MHPFSFKICHHVSSVYNCQQWRQVWVRVGTKYKAVMMRESNIYIFEILLTDLEWKTKRKNAIRRTPRHRGVKFVETTQQLGVKTTKVPLVSSSRHSVEDWLATFRVRVKKTLNKPTAHYLPNTPWQIDKVSGQLAMNMEEHLAAKEPNIQSKLKISI